MLPMFGYLAVALLLIGGIALMPRLAALVFRAARHGAAPNAGAAQSTLDAGAAGECAGPGFDRARRRAVELQPDGRDGDHGGELSRLGR